MNEPSDIRAGNNNQHDDVERQKALPEYPTIPWPLFVIFLLYIFAHYLQFGQRVDFFASIRFEFLLGLVLAVSSIFLYAGRKENASISVSIWAIALLLVFLLMVPLSIAPAHSWQIFFNFVFKFSLMALFLSTFVVTPTLLKWFLGAWLISFAKMAQEGIIGLIDGSMIWENQGVNRLHGATSIYRHPNSFAGTQLGTIPYLYELFGFSRSKIRFFFVIQAISAIVIIVFCGSRTAYLAFFVWLSYLIARARSRFRAVFVLICVGLLFVPIIPDQYVDRLQTVVSQQDVEGASIDTRKQILQDAWDIFLDKPFGLGVGAFPIERENRYGRIQDTHNLYLEVGTNLGVIGLIVFAGFIVSMIRGLKRLQGVFERDRKIMTDYCNCKQISRSLGREIGQHEKDLQILTVTCKATLAFIVIRLAVGLFGHDLYAIYWWFCLGLTLALANMSVVSTRKTRWFQEKIATAIDADQVMQPNSVLR